MRAFTKACIVLLFFLLPSPPEARASPAGTTLESVFVAKAPCQLPLASKAARCASLLPVLDAARLRADRHCRQAFRHHPWNCTTDRAAFRVASRETAFLEALFSAALAHEFSQSCARGDMPCHEPTTFGITFTRRLLHLKKAPLHDTTAHNVAVGLREVRRNIVESCRCLKYLGPCKIKSCKRSLPNFEGIAINLKKLYDSAVSWCCSNSAQLPYAHRRYGRQLVYMVETDTTCMQTGRACLSRSQCEQLCCTREFKTTRVPRRKMCHCRWEFTKQIRLKCETCQWHTVALSCN